MPAKAYAPIDNTAGDEELSEGGSGGGAVR